MKSYDDVFKFVREHYRADRFNNTTFHSNREDSIVKYAIQSLKDSGLAFISKHESGAGETIKFNEELEIL